MQIAGDGLDDHLDLVGAKTLRVLGQGRRDAAKVRAQRQGKAGYRSSAALRRSDAGELTSSAGVNRSRRITPRYRWNETWAAFVS